MKLVCEHSRLALMERERKLAQLSHHCARLSRLLEDDDQYVWHRVVEWLDVASCIKGVEVDLLEHTPGIQMCSGAFHYSSSREVLLAEFIKELSIFSLVWSALESAAEIETFGILRNQKGGKISAVNKYLNSVYSTRTLLPGYLEELGKFGIAAGQCYGYDRIRRKLSLSRPDASAACLAIDAVYSLRNEFAHGDLTFPEPDEDHEPVASNSNVVAHATRLVLLTIQMLALSLYAPATQSWPFELAADEEIKDSCLPLEWLLRTCQFINSHDYQALT